MVISMTMLETMITCKHIIGMKYPLRCKQTFELRKSAKTILSVLNEKGMVNKVHLIRKTCKK